MVPRRRALLMLALLLPFSVLGPPSATAAAAGADVLLVFDGQSNTRAPGPPYNYPYVVKAYGFPDSPAAIPAVSSTSYTDRTETAPERVDPFAQLGQLQALFTEGGQHDLVWERKSGEDVFWAIAVYVAGRREAGFDYVVAHTIPPSNAFSWWKEKQRKEANQYLRLYHRQIGIDVLVDIASDPRLQDPHDTDYYSDGTHYTALTAWIVGHLTLDAIRADAEAKTGSSAASAQVANGLASGQT